MGRIVALILVVVVVFVSAWRVATIISPDAISMAVGMLFGVLAGIPTAMMMKDRPPTEDEYNEFLRWRSEEQLRAFEISREYPQELVHRHYHEHALVGGEVGKDKILLEQKGSSDDRYA